MKHFPVILMRSACLLGIFFGVSACPLMAGDEPAWTVDALVRLALENNAELRFYEAEVLAAKGQRTQAGLWKNPELSGEYGERRIKDSSGQLQEEGATRGFSLTQTFEFPGKGSLRKAIANKNIELAEFGLKQFRLVLGGKVKQLAYRLDAQDQTVAAAEEIRNHAMQLTQGIRQRKTAGIQGLLDLRLIEAGMVADSNTVAEIEGEREETLAEMRTLLGLPSSQAFIIRVSPRRPVIHFDMNQTILQGLGNNLLLKTRRLELEKALQEVSAARLDAAPDFSVGPFFSQDKAGGSEENFGVTGSVTLPLWDWNQGNIATAGARRAQADAMLLQARREVEGAIVKRIKIGRVLEKQIAAFDGDFLTKMRDAADVSDRHFRLGAVSSTTYLEVQRQYLGAVRNYHNILLRLQENILDLELLTGGALNDSAANAQNSKLERKK